MALTTEEIRRRNAERMRKWRKANPLVHRAREAARYRKKRVEAPAALRAYGAKSARRWRKNNPDKAKAAVDRYHTKNPDARRRINLKRRYGISLDDFDQIFLAQGRCCAICARDTSGRGWCVDHDHETRKVRGILCHDCNTGVGFFADDPTRCRAAAVYLSHHSNPER